MKKYFVGYVILMLFTLGMGALFLEEEQTGSIHMDNTAVNDMMMTAKENWTDLDKVQDKATEYRLSCTILDSEEKVRQCYGEAATSIQKAVENRDVILPISKSKQILGYIIIEDGINQKMQKYADDVLQKAIVVVAVLLLLTMGFMFLLYKRIIRPFERLRGFAMYVAQGNLEIPLEMDRDNIFGSFTESFDIMREELAAARTRANAAEQSKKELIASLSHDIKTPVASIRAAVELLQVTIDNSKQQEKLAGIEQKTEQIELLINNLFHATLEELTELEVTLAEESSKTVRELISNSDYSGLIRTFEIPDCLLVCDKLRLGQIFDNIISNSYKYANTPIHVASVIVDGTLQIKIWDEGQSFSPEEIQHCCEKFFRGANGEGKTGAGLGLYISSYFMRKMGGALEASGENGFCVTIYLELA